MKAAIGMGNNTTGALIGAGLLGVAVYGLCKAGKVNKNLAIALTVAGALYGAVSGSKF